MKKFLSIILVFAISVLNLTGCTFFYHLPSVIPETNWEELEVYQVLSSGIDDDATLEEMVNAFEAMCQVPMETTCDVYVYDVYSYEFEGNRYLHFMVSRQFQIPTYYEFLDCGFSATFILEDDIADLSESIHKEMPWKAFIQAVKDSASYNKLLDKPIYERNVSIFSW